MEKEAVNKAVSEAVRFDADFAGDLNAMFKADQTAAGGVMDWAQWDLYGKLLYEAHPRAVIILHAEEHDYHDLASLLTQITAEQRAECFLRALGKWEDK